LIPTAAALTGVVERNGTSFSTSPSKSAYIFWKQIHSYSQTKQTILTVNRSIAAWEQKGRNFMKVKTNVKAGHGTVNITKNIAIVRQKGFYNEAAVYQIAVAASS
jgi:hypothetical protein